MTRNVSLAGSLPVLVLLSTLTTASPGRAVGIADIPSPRPNGWAVDLTGTLHRDDLQALDRLGDEVKAQTGAELAVVVIGSTDGAGAREFATSLANGWGIGEAEKDNGVLIFAALDDRAAEIILGDGVDGPEQVQASEAIMQGEMVPRFRAGDPGGAVFYGALAAARRILHATPTATAAPSEAVAPPDLMASSEENLSRNRELARRQREAFAARLAAAQELAVARPPRRRTAWPEALLVGLGLLTPIGGYLYYRRRPRRCKSCRSSLVRLDEVADDEHLDAGERTEERIGSVDYDVWFCAGCRRVEKLRYGAWYSAYASCPKCNARTQSSTETTIEHATTASGGRVRVDEQCANCDYRHSSTYSTPRLQERTYSSSSNDDSSWSRSSSTSDFSSSSSSSSSDSSPSSSSSSSGFGGGSSSGGGASGRW